MSLKSVLKGLKDTVIVIFAILVIAVVVSKCRGPAPDKGPDVKFYQDSRGNCFGVYKEHHAYAVTCESDSYNDLIRPLDEQLEAHKEAVASHL